LQDSRRISIAIDGDHIIWRNSFTTRTINQIDVMEVLIKSGSIVLVMNNGVKYKIPTNWFRQVDIVFLRDYFKGLKDDLN
jgi:hypothetical protein